MASIFNLPDNAEDVEEKLDLDDLYERKTTSRFKQLRIIQQNSWENTSKN